MELKKASDYKWQFARFGTSTSNSKNMYEGNLEDGIKLIAISGGGKFTTDGYDGISYYYTELNPDEVNFMLKAKFYVDDVGQTSNGVYSVDNQSGFAIIVRDSIGEAGSTANFPTNSVSTIAMGFDYTNEDGQKVEVYPGAGGRIVQGLQDGDTSGLKNTMRPLDKSIQTPGRHIGEAIKIGESYTFIMKKDNTGYRMIFVDANGTEHETIYYDTQNLLQITPDKVYLGFAAARYCTVTITDIVFETSDPATDPPAQERPIEEVDLTYEVSSPAATGNTAYTFLFRSIADGTLTLSGPDGNTVIEDAPVTANQYLEVPITLNLGSNVLRATFTPDPDFKLSEYEILSSYEPVSFTRTVTCRQYGTPQQTIMVTPAGTASGDGSRNNPLDIQTALHYAQPGQTILLAAETYSLSSTLRINRGINGREDAVIQLVSDLTSSNQAVLDFSGGGSLVINGNYWYIRGIDVCNTKDGTKGVQVAGKNNVLDQVNSHHNGDTGLQISGYSSDQRDYWPQNNLILNCCCYSNSDVAGKDADGFAAKLTCGPGNRFLGCISYNNVDDGWDLFAKLDTGTIDQVVIENCVSHHNGTTLEGKEGQQSGGNGFKLGGSNLSGNHILKNSISFENDRYGATSNSGLNPQVINSTLVDNTESNITLYTNVDTTTDYVASGVLSYRTSAPGDNDELKPKGQPSLESESNYLILNSTSTDVSSRNISGCTVAPDWFVSTDTSVVPTAHNRLADGSINMNHLYELTDAAASDAGARLLNTPSKEVNIPDVIGD